MTHVEFQDGYREAVKDAAAHGFRVTAVYVGPHEGYPHLKHESRYFVSDQAGVKVPIIADDQPDNADIVYYEQVAK